MVTVSEQIDFGDDLEGSNYKSCFARSVAVNSQLKQPKSLDGEEIMKKEQHKKCNVDDFVLDNNNCNSNSPEIIWRKFSRINDDRRLSYSSLASSRRTSICSSRITEIPVENIIHQSKIETLQWQLSEAEKNREMYRAVMNQVVTFLEKAHKSLEVLGNKLSAPKTVPRSKSDHQMLPPNAHDTAPHEGVDAFDDHTAFRDFTWRRPKKQANAPEELPPDKLAQEAFRLLRTIQSLLNTREPNLAHVTNSPVEDIDFLAQLAKEFPQTPESKPQRTTSFSVCPKLITPENEHQTKTPFNRKLSLPFRKQQQQGEFGTKTNTTDGDSSAVFSTIYSDCNKMLLHGKPCAKMELEKPVSGSLSSGEDESGFSSMNSFQDVGLPLVSSTLISEDVSSRNVLLRNMVTNLDHLGGFSSGNGSVLERRHEAEVSDIKLWQKPNNNVPYHKRFSSIPTLEKPKVETESMNVLWV